MEKGMGQSRAGADLQGFRGSGQGHPGGVVRVKLCLEESRGSRWGLQWLELIQPPSQRC